MNSSVPRSTKKTPFELMFGVKMRNPEDVQLATAMVEVIQEHFLESRVEIRATANDAIHRIQEENRLRYDRRRKAAQQYQQCGDLVAIKPAI